MAVRLQVALAVCLSILSVAGTVRAQDDKYSKDNDSGAIAVLPLRASEDRLAMYGMPVARALASQLKKSVLGPIHVWSATGSLPKRISLVVDGRIIARADGKVSLEARVRDPSRGLASGQVATREAVLTEVDKLAEELSSKLIELIASERRALSQAAKQVPAPALSSRESTSFSEQTPSVNEPVVVVGPDVEPIVTESLVRLVRRLGYKVRMADLEGIAVPERVLGVLKDTGSQYALLHEVLSVDYQWRGVLTARGTVRVVLVDTRGKALFDRTIHTDTLVGSRGDRHAALLGFVSRQVTDVAWPQLKRIVGR